MIEDEDEAVVGRLLAGNEREVGEALVLIDQRLRHRVIGWLYKSVTFVTEDALANAWSDTLVAVLQAVRAGRYDATRPVMPWLCQVAHARVVDQIRRERTRNNCLARLRQARREDLRCGPGRRAGIEEPHELVRVAQGRDRAVAAAATVRPGGLHR